MISLLKRVWTSKVCTVVLIRQFLSTSHAASPFAGHSFPMSFHLLAKWMQSIHRNCVDIFESRYLCSPLVFLCLTIHLNLWATEFKSNGVMWWVYVIFQLFPVNNFSGVRMRTWSIIIYSGTPLGSWARSGWLSFWMLEPRACPLKLMLKT